MTNAEILVQMMESRLNPYPELRRCDVLVVGDSTVDLLVLSRPGAIDRDADSMSYELTNSLVSSMRDRGVEVVERQRYWDGTAEHCSRIRVTYKTPTRAKYKNLTQEVWAQKTGRRVA